MLNQGEKKGFIPRTETKITETEERIFELRELTRPVAPENAIGRVSRMDAIKNKSINEAALRQLEVKLIRMKSAMEKVNNPDFGSCRSCGSEIPFGRLLPLPGSTQCAQCAS